MHACIHAATMGVNAIVVAHILGVSNISCLIKYPVIIKLTLQ